MAIVVGKWGTKGVEENDHQVDICTERRLVLPSKKNMKWNRINKWIINKYIN